MRTVAFARCRCRDALYTLDARLSFVVAGAIGLAGALVFAATVEERYAG